MFRRYARGTGHVTSQRIEVHDPGTFVKLCAHTVMGPDATATAASMSAGL